MPELVIDQVGAETMLDLYRQMFLIRIVEDACQDLYMKGLLHGTTHLCSGQEAVAVGANSVLGPDDRVACTYRGHGHSLALGMDLTAFIAELLGRRTGICGGRAGSMNLVDLEHRLIGCFGIVGGSVAAATGAGFALRGSGRLAVAYFGDGAVNQAYFPECLNLAKVFALPVVYVCENNQYGEFTPMETVTAGSIMGRVQAYDVPARQVDGMEVRAVRATMCAAVESARGGGGPVFIEALTYRFVGHSKSDPGRYRQVGELERWRARDPLKLARDALIHELGVGDEAMKRLESECLAKLAAAREAAIQAPFPEPWELASEFKQ
jgi:acetoin:2,6-dichlorophenolindophenol oxidoreductase subunit alpha